MPSLHVMFVFIIGIYTYRINRFIGVIAYIYSFIIFVGSVHLAWHYAVDGIVALVLGVMTWTVSGKILGARKHFMGAPDGHPYASPVSRPHE